MTQPVVRRRRSKHPMIVVIGGGRILPEYFNQQLRGPASCEIVTAMLPSEVLWRLGRQRVPVVICDDTAPGMRNFQLMREIKARSPQTCVVLVVPSGSPDQEQRAKAAGADVYLPQTFALRRLQLLLDSITI
ncbi:MAG TPA: response regulator [Kouleothrix sp.]|uniref:response regulator n=1 Tax=Kouleothrix sp. TaxID=2779161 RepID=UPI002B939F7C|nr:response regulator [Kouleothrix sp.]HRC77042.1 response regulator [Kouleothrix sp.]